MKRSKPSKKKEEVVEITTHAEENFSRYALIDQLKDTAFTTRFQYYVDHKPAANKSNYSHNSYAERKRIRKQEMKFGKALGINKVVLVEPFFYHLDLQNEEKIDFKATVSGAQNFQEVLRENAEKAKLEYVALDPQHMKEADVNSYNDFVNTNDWINERLMLGNNLRALVSASDQKDAIIAKYGTAYFMWTGVVSVTNKGLRSPTTYIYVMVYDMSREVLIYSENRQVKMRDSRAMLNSQYYDIFHQMHQTAAPVKVSSSTHSYPASDE